MSKAQNMSNTDSEPTSAPFSFSTKPQQQIILTMVKKIAPKSSGNVITNFIRQEITAPEKRAGNTSIAISLTVFGLAVTFLRSLGDMLGV
ncbi:hypothetical protein BGX21_008202 [Mortierella sp. AD011]|nr:hypothetical protein BGX20_001654 [Mortierella sp. AD010]KAF9398072.1 hypothetical protein BGX21_008202 [Mortierella sp. AD011]